MDDAKNLPATTDEAPVKPWEQEQKFILDFITNNYSPAYADNADLFISTQDFITKLESHLCVEISPVFLLNWLTENGFSYFDLPNMGFVWTMKRNNSTQVMMDNS